MFTRPPSLREVLGGANPPDDGALDSALASAGGSPWYVRLLVAGMAWLAALAITGFLSIAEIISQDSRLWWGLAAAAVAIVLARQAMPAMSRRSEAAPAGPRAEFLSQLALVLSLLARILVYLGADGLATNAGLDPQVIAMLSLFALEVLFLLTIDDGLQRFLASALSGVWLLAALDGANLGSQRELLLQESVTVAYAAAAGALWLAGPGPRSGRWATALRPMGYGATVFVLGAIAALSIDGLIEDTNSRGLVLAIGLGLLAALLLARILRELGRMLLNRRPVEIDTDDRLAADPGAPS